MRSALAAILLWVLFGLTAILIAGGWLFAFVFLCGGCSGLALAWMLTDNTSRE